MFTLPLFGPIIWVMKLWIPTTASVFDNVSLISQRNSSFPKLLCRRIKNGCFACVCTSHMYIGIIILSHKTAHYRVKNCPNNAPLWLINTKLIHLIRLSFSVPFPRLYLSFFLWSPRISWYPSVVRCCPSQFLRHCAPNYIRHNCLIHSIVVMPDNILCTVSVSP